MRILTDKIKRLDSNAEMDVFLGGGGCEEHFEAFVAETSLKVGPGYFWNVATKRDFVATFTKLQILSSPRVLKI